MSDKNYINNVEFENIIKKYKKNPKENESELMLMFDILIDNIIESFRFKLDKEDAKQDCFVLILKTLPNFNTDKGTAFNYFTTIIVHNLKLLYTKNKRYDTKIRNYLESKSEGITPDGSNHKS
jgi:DNA-directed RNA polymerase specialized sigma subunit